MSEQQLDNILVFEPQYKSVIWGGSRIAQLKNERLSKNNIGESWEISSINGHESVVAEGQNKGLNITELAERYGEVLLGENVVKRYGKTFPLLIKLIDADDILSLQVHPDDNVAEKYHNSRGKSEMWYIIDAQNDARIYCGLSESLTPESFNSLVNDKTIMDKVASYTSKEGQFYFIPAGTIHSIGAGNLIAEIQESSDITYRVYDHDRKDADGNPRQLHVEQACAALNFSYPNEIEPTARSYSDTTKDAVINEHFNVDYYKLRNSEINIRQDHSSFTTLLVTKGTVEIDADGITKEISAGHTVLIPAFVSRITLSGTGIVLAAHI